MNQMKRFAIYYAPRPGAFADAAARWLGWDLQQGCASAQPDLPGLVDQTAAPRKYGFHGTIKPPFRLATGVTPEKLARAVEQLATGLQSVEMPGLEMRQIDSFLAFVPHGNSAALLELAAAVVQGLDPYRAPLSPAEVTRRQPEKLTPRQRALLDSYGYPFVMDEFQFHLTLSGPLSATETPTAAAAAAQHFAGMVPTPFVLDDLCLCGEDGEGRFHLLQRYALSA